MPLGIVSDKDFIREINNVQPQIPTVEKKIDINEVLTPELVPDDESSNGHDRGRGVGSVEVPNSLRRLIGDESINNGRQAALELAESFGLSASSVSAYTNGSTSTASYDKRINSDVINGAKLKVSNRARKVVLRAINKITDEKLSECTARELSGVAKDMSQIMINMEPKQEQNNKTEVNGPTFVLYKPQVKPEEAFNSVLAKE